jgi:N6-L-threonylcarbamoyladenine synthase
MKLEVELFILAIESSCDDTSAAVLKGNVVLSNVVSSQDIHRQYGGVVPELASREHQKNILPVVDVALREAGLSLKEINAVAFTQGPGLMGSLLVGCNFAKSLSLALGLPLIAVNHMEAHVMAHFIQTTEGKALPELPLLCLTVSGGHTQIVLVKEDFSMDVIGTTIDDAAGEAFDKAAKVLGLPYPGGPLIDQMAAGGNPHAFTFPVPQVPELNYSFSGLKTSFLYLLKEKVGENPNFIEERKYDLCASIQHAVVDILLRKFRKAILVSGVKHIALAGGVSANSLLRKEMLRLGEEMNCEVYIPPMQYCTDNAAMVGIAGLIRCKNRIYSTMDVRPITRYENFLGLDG